jgi:hypothetical protein
VKLVIPGGEISNSLNESSKVKVVALSDKKRMTVAKGDLPINQVTEAFSSCSTRIPNDFLRSCRYIFVKNYKDGKLSYIWRVQIPSLTF